MATNFTVEDRRSACPGLFRMAKALDGSICRVKLTFGDLSAEQARRVSQAARQFGNGAIEITNRANLQLRGVRPETEDALIAALLDAGLGPLTDRGDDVRNVMVSPVAGIDGALIDVRPLAHRLLAKLQTDASYQTLSPKFSVLVDGGENVAMVEHPHDIWVSPLDPAARAPQFAFGVAGAPPTQRGGDRPVLGCVSDTRVFTLVTTILDVFIEWNRGHPASSRLRHFTAEAGADALLEQLEHRLGFSVRNDAVSAWYRPPPRANAHIGLLPESASTCLVGAMPPLGRLNPELLVALAALADDHGNGQLRLTPWQSILLPGVATARAESALAHLESLGLHADPKAPLATMISCSGSAGCGSALGATQADGLKLAARLGSTSTAPQVHLSGCMKSCASPWARPITLVATAPQRYDIFLQATDGPSRFGKLLAANVTIEEAAALIGENFGASEC
ncbi:MAG: precorrin-3B synthase [Phyllobacterium sp.]|uniref:precorrin-3B synthase n=1 Tax=Phyllobacterium sp. TaxID=1871046 RepID=UPI0030F1D641